MVRELAQSVDAPRVVTTPTISRYRRASMRRQISASTSGLPEQAVDGDASGQSDPFGDPFVIPSIPFIPPSIHLSIPFLHCDLTHMGSGRPRPRGRKWLARHGPSSAPGFQAPTQRLPVLGATCAITSFDRASLVFTTTVGPIKVADWGTTRSPPPKAGASSPETWTDHRGWLREGAVRADQRRGRLSPCRDGMEQTLGRIAAVAEAGSA